MSIVINGISMPKGETILLVLSPNGEVWIEAEEEPFPYRTKAVELPPHGRLVDADALCSFLQDEYHGMISDEEMKIYKILWMLDDAPTIIEAETCNKLSETCNKTDEDAVIANNGAE